MYKGFTDDGKEVYGCSPSDVLGKIEYARHFEHLSSGETAYHFTEYVYEKYDVHFDSCSRADEIKYRDISASKYVKDGYVLEKTKYDCLKQFDKGYFMCYFKQSNLFMVWDINKINPKWEIRYCAKDCQFGGYKQKKPKIVTDLPFDDAITILWKNKSLNKEEKERCKKWLLNEIES